METNLIKDIATRYEKRKKAKSAIDSRISLSVTKDEKKVLMLSATTDGKTVRLLDEGMVVDAEGRPLFYIKRGVLKAFYDNLSDEYVGSINLGHMDFATFPYLLGQWTKEDLKLVDIGDSRQGIDVNLNLDEESIFVKELKRNKYSIGVSAEFPYNIDWDSTYLLGYEVLDKIEITDFAIVGEAGNASSGGIFLKGEPEMAKEVVKENILAKLAAKYLGLGKVDDPKDPVEPPAEPTTEPEEPETEPKEDEITEEQIAEVVNQAAEALEERDKMMGLMTQMDKELDETKAELEAAKAELEEAKKSLMVKTSTVTSALGKLAELTTKYGTDQKELAAKLAESQKQKEKKMSAAYESEDGFGRYE